eukprot:GHVR01045430.1.p1 GENE.GHVR01045430.1~~GHVR01045430.1.p1  ORF type:complete len:110 (-),score=17.58 GHVR01045430.1:89-418(-)
MNVIKWLHENGADLEKKDNDGYTALCMASQEGHLDVVKWLIQKGASVNTTNNEGTTPLIFASGKGHVNVIKLLHENGADLQKKNNLLYCTYTSYDCCHKRTSKCIKVVA